MWPFVPFLSRTRPRTPPPGWIHFYTRLPPSKRERVAFHDIVLVFSFSPLKRSWPRRRNALSPWREKKGTIPTSNVFGWTWPRNGPQWKVQVKPLSRKREPSIVSSSTSICSSSVVTFHVLSSELYEFLDTIDRSAWTRTRSISFLHLHCRKIVLSKLPKARESLALRITHGIFSYDCFYESDPCADRMDKKTEFWRRDLGEIVAKAVRHGSRSWFATGRRKIYCID